MKDPLHFPNAAQFKRDREARARTRRSVGRAWLRAGQAPSAIGNRPLAPVLRSSQSEGGSPTEAPAPVLRSFSEGGHITAASVICRRCGRKIVTGTLDAEPVLTTCKECLKHQ